MGCGSSTAVPTADVPVAAPPATAAAPATKEEAKVEQPEPVAAVVVAPVEDATTQASEAPIPTPTEGDQKQPTDDGTSTTAPEVPAAATTSNEEKVNSEPESVPIDSPPPTDATTADQATPIEVQQPLVTIEPDTDQQPPPSSDLLLASQEATNITSNNNTPTTTNHSEPLPSEAVTNHAPPISAEPLLTHPLSAVAPAPAPVPVLAKVPPPGPPKPHAVFVFGGPGTSKGVQCAHIVKELGWIHLNVSDLLREERKARGTHAKMIEEYIIQSKPVPGEISASLVRTAITSHFQLGHHYFILDGFPRTLDHLLAWKKVLGGYVEILFVLQLECSEEVMLKRLINRGQGVGHSGGHPPDELEVADLKKRFHAYEEESQPMLERYQKTGRVKRVDANLEPDQVWSRIKEIFQQIP